MGPKGSAIILNHGSQASDYDQADKRKGKSPMWISNDKERGTCCIPQGAGGGWWNSSDRGERNQRRKNIWTDANFGGKVAVEIVSNSPSIFSAPSIANGKMKKRGVVGEVAN